ncbi:Uncharacterised protein [Bordetella pertussis]|nr:Uncharacterised protein [Bordetella pertussis]CFM32478.1 Uncharacterised protein [Bordetella pertussis]CFN21706.1 Uncharacterised protein [Bordetella pertussis]CFN76918.1 Uncharacterised protein [Bordetella pertussis]CFP48159.1 Uncharacterised protein [Bordetella pertussis]
MVAPARLGRTGQRHGRAGRGAGRLLRQVPARHGRGGGAAGRLRGRGAAGRCDHRPAAAGERAADPPVHGAGGVGGGGGQPPSPAGVCAAVGVLRRPLARPGHAEAVWPRRGRGAVGRGGQRRLAPAHDGGAAHRFPVLGRAGVLRGAGRGRRGGLYRPDLPGLSRCAGIGADLAGRVLLPVAGSRGIRAVAPVRRSLPRPGGRARRGGADRAHLRRPALARG